MTNFTVFNTLAQADNYVNRTKDYSYDEGCGCCYNRIYTVIKKDRVLSIHSGSHRGEYYDYTTVIGRIKKK